ncbi:hypothetical protein QOT17_012187 [Balamuthia mandrillaris]
MKFYKLVCRAAVLLIVVALLGPATFIYLHHDQANLQIQRVAPSTGGTEISAFRSCEGIKEKHTGDPPHLRTPLLSPQLLTALLDTDEPTLVKTLLDPVASQLVTLVWTSREKFSHAKTVFEDWWNKDSTGIRSVFVLNGLEPPDLVTWLREQERTVGKHRLTVMEDTSLLPPFAAINVGLEQVTTPYVICMNTDNFLEDLAIHYLLRRALLSPDAGAINPFIWEVHHDVEQLRMHHTYELLVATKTPAHSRMVPRYIHLPRDIVTIPYQQHANLGSLTRKYAPTQLQTAMGVEFHCALFETAIAKHPYKLLDTYTTENPLNAAFVLAELNRHILVEPQAIIRFVFPTDGKLFKQEDVFMMAWAWSAEMGFINNCYAESKFGHLTEDDRLTFWMYMSGVRMRGSSFGMGTPTPLNPDPNLQTQLIIGMFLIIGANRFRLMDQQHNNPQNLASEWMGPRQVYAQVMQDTNEGKSTLFRLAFTQLEELPLPRWEGPLLQKWMERVAIHESQDKASHQGFVMQKESRSKVDGYDCGHQVYRQYHLLRMDFVGEKDVETCVSALPSQLVNEAFIILSRSSGQGSEFDIMELWFEFPDHQAADKFREEALPAKLKAGGEPCSFVQIEEQPKSIVLPRPGNNVRLLRWKHDIDYRNYDEQLAKHIIPLHPHESKRAKLHSKKTN